MNLFVKLQSNKVALTVAASAALAVGVMNVKNTDLSMNVVDLLRSAGIIAPSWVVTAITTTGSVLAVATLIGTLGAGAPAALLEQLAAASTAAA
ncbi:hypothetical protein GTY48_14030 [Bacillus thuringiensis]|uniref:hypothetical protein n=1 Tax=Bacillus TaxID=1386 RepID=UPI00136D750C|nr:MULTISPECIES: hypothetical protein [Bacillus]MBK5515739.1 hypothetical protein [Bacillus sp. TH11]MBK5508548.1 hypothetical protein [Bacillus sp. TH12]MED2879967.1 hypothetical protein [Bacillus thuringiensis]MYW24752.1 hypothetical protein [Bacillus thuringiensis]MYW24766.1 hypothetical protein [Bacillus thuringiensis]